MRYNDLVDDYLNKHTAHTKQLYRSRGDKGERFEHKK